MTTTFSRLARDLVISYLIEKNKLIETHTKIQYITDTDIYEVKSWPLHSIINLLENLCRDMTDDRICPWCVFLDKRCEKCGYGSRHRNCGSHKSTYDKIISSKTTNIVNIPGMEELREDFVDRAVRILELMEKKEIETHINPNLRYI